MHVIIRNTTSLMKKFRVTLIFLSGAARRDTPITKLTMKKDEPISEATCKFKPFSSPPAAIAAKTSGAPFPKAKRVTPARDSEQENLSEIASKAGERY